jgi:hypothetical protein
MADKKFIVVAPEDKYKRAACLAKANGMSVNALVRSLMIRATLMPEEFGLVPNDVEDFQSALAPVRVQ